MLESVSSIGLAYAALLNQLEWGITIVFSLEYIARILVVKKPWKYITSFFGIIDLLSLLPKYISFFFMGSGSLVALRALRLLRVFRILKLSRYIGESNFLMTALWASRVKIGVFLFAVIILCIIFGTIMYLVEGEANGFTSIPRGIYWCIVTLTTVGYGDIAPMTSLGRFIASIIMILGYGIIAVPTGIVTSEMTQQHKNPDTNTQACPSCMNETHLMTLYTVIIAETNSMKQPKLLYIAGPTASGKTSLAIALAKEFNTQIISCDSRQFYKEMSIGTAVPTPDELAQAPHHFVQHLSIHDNYSVGDYTRDSLSLLPTLFKQNEIVIMVGVLVFMLML